MNTSHKKRKKAERPLLESEEFYRELANSITDVFFAMDEKLRYTYWNRASEKLTGISAKDTIGKYLYDLFPHTPHTRNAEKIYRKVLKTQRPHTFVNEYQIKGKNLFFEISAYPTKHGLSVFVKDITERKQMKQVLLNSEREKSAILNAMSELVAYQDTNHNIIWTNKAAAQSVNENAENLQGRKCYEIWAGKENECEICPVAEAIKTEKMQQEEITTPDGRTWSIRGYPVKNKTGNIIGVIEVTLNITERKQIEESLGKERDLLNVLMNNVLDFIYFKDIKSRFIRVNKALAQKFNIINPGQAVGKTDFDFFTEEHARQAFEDEQKIIQTGHPVVDLEEKETWPDRQETWVSTTKMPMRDETGNIVGTFGISRDITERKRAEYKYGLIIKTTLDGFWINDSKGRFLEVNESYCSMIGYTREELLTMSITDIEALEKPDETAQRIKKIIKQGHDRFETQHRRKDSKIIDVEISINYVPMERQYFVFVRNITDRKLAEEQIQNDLHEKEILIRELYHRTKNNMQVISSMLKLKARYIRNKEVTATFKEIDNKILTMALVHQKLYESRDLSHINLKEYINDLVSLIKQSQIISSKKLTFLTEGEDVNVLIDTAIPLGIAINELVTNSLKYGFPGNRKGEIKIHLQLTEKKELVIDVSDNGVGLSKDFEIQKDVHLGLKMVTDLIEHQLQGKISFKSKQGLQWQILLKKELNKPRI
ncbi:PAS domain-containing protein [bacterium]|nr:PAS domain-containing protein [candidate division CSSED10-310 bacterium]